MLYYAVGEPINTNSVEAIIFQAGLLEIRDFQIENAVMVVTITLNRAKDNN